MPLVALRRAVLFMLVLTATAVAEEQPLLEFIEPDSDSRTSAAVLVGPCALAHTAQILPVDGEGKLVGTDLRAQLAQVIANLKRALAAAGTGLEHAVRLHVYTAHPDGRAECRRLLGELLPAAARPAVTWTMGKLPRTGALVMIDAIAAVPRSEVNVTHHRVADLPTDGRAHVSILPPGRAVYVSGQAEPGETLADAARHTLASLSRTLEHLGLDRTHVVHVKTFLQPMDDVAQADQAIAAFFDGMPVPATVHVEWTMAAPVEIELVAWAPEGTARQAEGPVSFITPPGMRPSPLFARVVVTDSPRVLYTSGLAAPAGENAEQEVEKIFHRLESLLATAGSDFRHLAKATYYVADEDVSRALNAVRPNHYDPHRPPAASKAPVRGAGPPGSRISIDIIAVPKSR